MNVLLVGHPVGIKQLLKFLPTKTICGIMGAGNRPQFHAELTSLAHQLQVPLFIQPKKSEPYWMERERERDCHYKTRYSALQLLLDAVTFVPTGYSKAMCELP